MAEKYFEINKNGHNVRCKLYYDKIPEIQKIIIYCHGFAGHKDSSYAKKFGEKITSKYKAAAMIVFDWPCHGEDVKKKLTLDYCDEYLELVIEYAKEQFYTDEIYAYAASFGGYEILRYIAGKGSPFKKISLKCPAVNMYDSFTGVIMKPGDEEKLKKGKSVNAGFDRLVAVTQNFVNELRECDIRKNNYLDFAYDMIIIHGTEDTVIPFEEVKKFAENNLIEFYPISGADHRFQRQTESDFATKTTLEFFEL